MYGNEVSQEDQDKPGDFTVELKAAGNPDFGQNPYRGLPGVNDSWRRVKTMAEASKVCQEFISEHDLGGGNWAGGDIRSWTGGDPLQDGKVVARVSYNGRVWLAKA